MPKAIETDHLVQSWSRADVIVERHRYPPGPAGELPPHVHDSYQICVCPDFPGEYIHRRGRHHVPRGALAVIPPGEVHAARDPHDRDRPTTFEVVYVPPTLVDDLTGRVPSATMGLALGTPVITNPVPISAVRAIVRSAAAPELAFWHHLAGVLSWSAPMHAPADGGASPSPAQIAGVARRHAGVARALTMITDRWDEDLPLATLAASADLSPHAFARAFTRFVGLSPHAYVLAVRIDHAKRRLCAGAPVSAVALEAGFADQSHFHRHFRRHLGTTPGQYVANHRRDQGGSAVGGPDAVGAGRPR